MGSLSSPMGEVIMVRCDKMPFFKANLDSGLFMVLILPGSCVEQGKSKRNYCQNHMAQLRSLGVFKGTFRCFEPAGSIHTRSSC